MMDGFELNYPVNGDMQAKAIYGNILICCWLSYYKIK